MTAMTQTNHAIHLIRIRGVSGSSLRSLRPGDGKRYADAKKVFAVVNACPAGRRGEIFANALSSIRSDNPASNGEAAQLSAFISGILGCFGARMVIVTS